ncbi:hypothetical protein [Roseiflexus sp.]|uniref:hypothetical protein n=1 Tax=Roseiflexus sp. TaxID=2562120 RepID=UPI002585FA1A|nr:hypothetical protein [Roseiflexus sp.]
MAVPDMFGGQTTMLPCPTQHCSIPMERDCPVLISCEVPRDTRERLIEPLDHHDSRL